MPHKSIFFVLAMLMVGPALADTCEDSFQKQGNLLVGTTFTASVSTPGISVSDAIAQMRGIAVGKGMDVITADAKNGSMLIEEPEGTTHKSIPFLINSRSENGATTVQMTIKLNSGAFASAKSVKQEMCEMLTQVQSGEAGQQNIAKGEHPAARAATPVKALLLSTKMENQADDGVAAVNARYKDKPMRITGRADDGALDGVDGTKRLAFDIKDRSNFHDQRAIICVMAPDQTAYALSVRPRDKLDLTGTFLKYESIGNEIWLKDCRSS